MRIAGSFPFLPQRLMVSDDTRRMPATSLMVKRSGRSESDTLLMFGIVSIIKAQASNVNSKFDS